MYKSFNDRLVLKDINIKLNKGELVSLVGVSGSGKTTLFNIIAGLLAPDEGKVYLKGKMSQVRQAIFPTCFKRTCSYLI